jgi:DNA repair ATPase RecN
MGRKAYFTEKQIFEAADTLAAQGKEVTAPVLLQVLGGGSYTSVYKYLKIWQETRPELAHMGSAPAALPEPVQTAFVAAWKVAASEAAQEVAAVRDKAAEDVKAANKQLEEALEQIERLEKEIETEAAQVESLTVSKAELEASLQAAENQKAALVAKSDQLMEQVFKLEQSRDEAAQLKGQVELLKAQNTEILDRLADRDKPKK